MKHYPAREWTVEEFDAWMAASDREEAIAQAADEEGGPRLSLVPATDRKEVWPTDLLPPAVAPRRTTAPKRRSPPRRSTASNWRTAASASPAGAPSGSACSSARSPRPARSISPAAAARLSARSAYRLRARSPAFAAAWDTADQLAVGRLSALAFDRAISGRIEQVWQGGRAGRRETGAERPAADVAAGPARSPPLRRPVGAAQGRRRRSAGRGAGELSGATRRAVRYRLGIKPWPVRTLGTFA